jgi:hypothetical protein
MTRDSFLSAGTGVGIKLSGDADRPRESGGDRQLDTQERNTTRGGARFPWR